MKTILKTIALGSIPLLTGAAMGAGVDSNATQSATRPATQASAEAIASANAPLVIPDGTAGPVPVTWPIYEQGRFAQQEMQFITGIRI